MLKLQAGAPFPVLPVLSEQGERVDIGQAMAPASWRILVVYRGRHCPLCTRYLNQLEAFVGRLQAIATDLVAVSADSLEQLQEHRQRLQLTFPLFHGLSDRHMVELGLYISNPRSEKETDHRFAEPGLFVINEQRRIQVVDLSNNPFVRPDPETLVSGLEWIRNPENHYPIRGTWWPEAAQ
ncbi:redoxin domain-containing protein [Synechococcus sp. RSCCF101]|nr:redoxin domain-containing protein [Synechococcus sp. RSCCF101]